MKNHDHFVRQASRLGSLSFISSALGFAREILIARDFGASHITDSYLIALSVPMLIYALFFGSGLNVSLVPRLTSALQQDASLGIKVFAQFLSGAAACSLLVSCLIFAFPDFFVRVLAPGVAHSHVTTDFVRALAPLLFLLVISYTLGSFHCAREKAAHWGLVTVVQNLVLVLALLFFYRFWGVGVLVAATLGGAFLAMLIQAQIAKKDGLNEAWINPFRAGEGQRILLSMVPFALAFGIGGDYGTAQADIFLIRFFGSQLKPGSITLLALGNKLMALPVLFIGAAMGIALLSPLSAAVARRDNQEAGEIFITSMSYAVLVACPLAILYFDLSAPIASLVFRRTLLAADQLQELAAILKAYSGAVVGLVLVYVMTSYMAALKRTRALICSGALTILIDALLMWWLRSVFQSMGIAAAVSIGSLCYCFFLLVQLIKHLSRLHCFQLIKRCGLVLVGACGMHVTLLITLRLHTFTSVPWFGGAILPALTGFTLYVIWLAMNRSRLQIELAS